MSYPNLSADVFWECTRNRSSYMVKRGHGTSQTIFSKEPMNLKNIHSRKNSGLVNEKAIGVMPGTDRGVILITKTSNEKNGQKPIKLFQKTELKKHNRKVYGSIVNTTAKKYYRPDLRADAVARASAILHSQRKQKGSSSSA
ncbi:ribosomal L28e/Mak16 [Pyronema domesticum]|uniref:Similar to Probable 60S ribosomal protein L28e acc. no. O14069 n=1 Tax=Pyronema omphalodes (strain CBS 100304) TaxID=1076935 RepID=U4LIE7_PYROM|nr:ribosomal L28e/Mak16 [Pyronema domesticum]CCX12114.1 Similar to Probable 60S ribosomal protein L28e; acc. no. O14069 [Pyronema omphalodes CBS 100304]